MGYKTPIFDTAEIKHFIETHPPALADKINEAEQALHLVIPDIYKAFLRSTDGALGNFASLYGTQELVEMNKTYGVQEYAPGYIAIGNDHGGYHLLMRAEKEEMEFRLVSDGVGVVTNSDCKDTFVSWLLSENGDPWRNKPCGQSESALVELVLVKLPADGKKGLLRLKKALRLSISITDLARETENLPYILCAGMTLTNARAKIRNTAERDIFEIRFL